METVLVAIVIGIAIAGLVMMRDRLKRMDAQHSEIRVPTLRNRTHKYLGDSGWELFVGGTWLHKVGAVVLAIWLALFLAYSFTNRSPGERTMTCVATSWTLLIAGC